MNIFNRSLSSFAVRIILFTFISSSFYSFANELNSNVPRKNEINKISINGKESIKVIEYKDYLLEFYLSENKRISDNQLTQKMQIEYLEKKLFVQTNKEKSTEKALNTQHLKISLLEQQLKTKIANDSDSISLSGIIVTASGVIITTLAVIMALLTFVGYKDIINKAEMKARDVASNIINEIASTEITKLIDSGVFEEHINGAVDRVVYKDLFVDPELREDKNDVK